MYDCTCMYVCVLCSFKALEGQKWALDPLELEIQMVVNLQVCWESNPGFQKKQPVCLTA